MAGKKSFLSGAEEGWAFTSTMARAVLKAGGTDRDIRHVLSQKHLANQLAWLILLQKKNTANTFHLLVNYDLSLKAMSQLGLGLRYVDPHIKDEDFPQAITGLHEVTLKLLKFKKDLPNTLKYLAAKNVRPASLKELVPFTFVCPKSLWSTPIIALSRRQNSLVASRVYPFLNEGTLGLTSDEDIFKSERDLRLLVVCE